MMFPVTPKSLSGRIPWLLTVALLVSLVTHFSVSSAHADPEFTTRLLYFPNFGTTVPVAIHPDFPRMAVFNGANPRNALPRDNLTESPLTNFEVDAFTILKEINKHPTGKTLLESLNENSPLPHEQSASIEEQAESFFMEKLNDGTVKPSDINVLIIPGAKSRALSRGRGHFDQGLGEVSVVELNPSEYLPIKNSENMKAKALLDPVTGLFHELVHAIHSLLGINMGDERIAHYLRDPDVAFSANDPKSGKIQTSAGADGKQKEVLRYSSVEELWASGVTAGGLYIENRSTESNMVDLTHAVRQKVLENVKAALAAAAAHVNVSESIRSKFRKAQIAAVRLDEWVFAGERKVPRRAIYNADPDFAVKDHRGKILYDGTKIKYETYITSEGKVTTDPAHLKYLADPDASSSPFRRSHLPGFIPTCASGRVFCSDTDDIKLGSLLEKITARDLVGAAAARLIMGVFSETETLPLSKALHRSLNNVLRDEGINPRSQLATLASATLDNQIGYFNARRTATKIDSVVIKSEDQRKKDEGLIKERVDAIKGDTELMNSLEKPGPGGASASQVEDNAKKLASRIENKYSKLPGSLSKASGLGNAAQYIASMAQVYTDPKTSTFDKVDVTASVVPVVGQFIAIAHGVNANDTEEVAINMAVLGIIAVSQAIPIIGEIVDIAFLAYSAVTFIADLGAKYSPEVVFPEIKAQTDHCNTQVAKGLSLDSWACSTFGYQGMSHMFDLS
ncbi:M91 family zinc metallopeptidase [Streptomyces sp. NPDC046161]|uniref:M91 family zinc metallopeptidase n=1 Tax=Streptomyces sp. NPDC046161 TaxID=3155132 RepID=UPI0033FC5F76